MKKVVQQISGIKPQKNKNRVNIFIDNEFAFGVEKDVAVKYNLHIGDRLSESKIESLLRDDEIKRAKRQTLNFLRYRARSVWEIKNKLKIKAFSKKIIEEVIADFQRVGFLNDKEFSGVFVRSKMVSKPVSKYYLLMELEKKGIDKKIAETAVEQNYGDLNEFQIAEELLKIKLKNKIPENPRVKKRTVDFLKGRGFNWEIIQKLLNDNRYWS